MNDELRYLDFFLGTLAPFFRASESPMAIACFRLLTVPPLPPLPDFSVPLFFRCMALLTLLPAAFPYLAIAFLPSVNRRIEIGFDFSGSAMTI